MGILTVQNPEALETVLCEFLKKNERVLLCYQDNSRGLGALFGEMVERCGGVPVFWGSDLRWKDLLRQGFAHRCGAVIGEPSVVLGLSKLAKRLGTPLYIRHTLLAGDMPDPWLSETICGGLDCIIPGCCVLRKEEQGTPAADLKRELRRWTSVLDFRLSRGSGGLSLEMVVFPGEKLPKLPTLAKLQVREWNPEQDIPFDTDATYLYQ